MARGAVRLYPVGLLQGQGKKLSDAGYRYAATSGNQQHAATLAEHAAARGMEIIGMEPQADDSDDFYYWYDGHDAVLLFFDCHDQWREGFGGITAFDMTVVLGLLPLYRTKKSQQLELYRDVRAFVAGVLRYIVEQREKLQRA